MEANRYVIIHMLASTEIVLESYFNISVPEELSFPYEVILPYFYLFIYFNAPSSWAQALNHMSMLGQWLPFDALGLAVYQEQVYLLFT